MQNFKKLILLFIFGVGVVNGVWAENFDKSATLLMIAANHAKLEIVEKLIKEGSDVNKKDSKGNTALFYAIESRANNRDVIKCCELLINAGAKINFDDYSVLKLILNHAEYSEIRKALKNDLGLLKILKSLGLKEVVKYCIWRSIDFLGSKEPQI